MCFLLCSREVQSFRGPNAFCNEKKTWGTGAEDAFKLLLTMISSDTCRCLKSLISFIRNNITVSIRFVIFRCQIFVLRTEKIQQFL